MVIEKVNLWNDKASAQKELKKRLDEAKSKRAPWEQIWQSCMREAYMAEATDDLPALFAANGLMPAVQVSTGRYTKDVAASVVPQEYSKVYCNYLQKNIRYSISQLSNNPPSVIPQPISPDPKDKKASEAANSIIKYCLRFYRLQEVKDKAAVWTHTCGSSWTKLYHDPQLGDPLEYNPETQELLTTGDLSAYVPKLWDIYPDPMGKEARDIRYIFEHFEFPREKAEYYFGEYLSKKTPENQHGNIDVYQYWEKGLPANGFMGRFCWVLEDGTILAEKIIPNPFGPLKKLRDGNVFRMAQLPYHLLTDIDIPGTFWGVPACYFTIELQKEVNMVDRLTFTNIRSNGSSTMIAHEDCELGDDSITNDPCNVIIWRGNIPPTVQTPTPVSPIIPQLRTLYTQQIPEIHGINESQFGKQSRETSGSAMQYATQQGVNLNARLFTKYVQYVEDMYKACLLLVQEHWDDGRLVTVEGKENSFKVIEFRKADIEAGYEFQSKYGTDFSLDPQMRRQEIMQLLPLLKEAQVNPAVRPLLAKLQLNDIDSIFADVELASARQREIFERMIDDPRAQYIPPEDQRDHANMIAYANTYMMSAEFDRLENANVKRNIERHVREREEMEASKQAKAITAQAPPGAGGQAPGAVPGAAPAGTPPPNLASLLGSKPGQ